MSTSSLSGQKSAIFFIKNLFLSNLMDISRDSFFIQKVKSHRETNVHLITDILIDREDIII